MKVVETLEELESNLSLFESYFSEGTDDEQNFVYNLVKKGTCFISYEIEGEVRFAPSRYIGYSNTSREKHLENKSKDGKDTNPAITKVIGSPLIQNLTIEEKFIAFAKNLGISPDNRERKYWFYKIEHSDFADNRDSEEGFPEGKIVERKHKSRERSSELTALAKSNYLKKQGHLPCMVCEFDFNAHYGDRGEGYIEAHHTKPVSELKPGEKTQLEDIALVCSNCHRMLHRYRPWLKINELRKIMQKKI